VFMCLYAVIAWLCLPALYLMQLWKYRRNENYWQRSLEHFVIGASAQTQKHVWIHAASLGEAKIACEFIRALRQQTQIPIIVTTNTPTGAQTIEQANLSGVSHRYVPFDCSIFIKRFISIYRVSMLILVEREVWPQTLMQCQRLNIPTALINARLSPRSLQRYMFAAKFFQPLFASLAWVAAQTPRDAEHLQALGVKTDACIITGNIKFDFPASVTAQLIAPLRQRFGHDRQIIVAGSTHAGEEEILLGIFRQLQQRFSNLLLILTPRHPERFPKVHELAQEAGFKVASFAAQTPCTAATEVIIGDTIGDLQHLYACADIAFVGGSLVPIGGHNLLEPAALGVATLTGEYVFNFTEIRDVLVQAKALIVCRNEAQLLMQLQRLLLAPEIRAELASNAQAIIKANQGATAKHEPIIHFAAQLTSSS